MPINSITGNTLLESGYFAPCKVAATGPLTLSGIQTIDGVALNAGDRVLAWQQADATTNGIYAVSSGTWVRTTDAASNAAFFNGMRVAIAQGALYTAQTFQCTSTDDPVIVGSSNLTFATAAELQSAQATGTSTSVVAVGTGAKTFTTQSGLSFQINQWVLAYDADGNAMLGQITAYSGPSLTINSVSTSGSGSHADWTIVLTNSSASIGLMPPLGTGNVTGPGSSTAGHAATFADGTGKVLQDGGLLGTLAARNTGATLYGDLGTASVSAANLAPGAAPLPFVAAQPNDNLHLSNDGTNATRDIDVSAGRVRDDSDITNLQLNAAMVKRLDQAWAAGGVAGSPAGGCDSGSKGNSQTWHVFLIGNLAISVTGASRTSNVATLSGPSISAGVGQTIRVYGAGNGFDGVATVTAVGTNTVSYANTGSNTGALTPSADCDLFDILASQSYSSPTLPSGFTAKQCLGSFLTDSSANLIAMFHYGDEFWLKTPVLNVNGAAGGTDALETLTVPLGVKLQAIMNLGVQTGTTINVSYGMYVCSPDATDPTSGGIGATSAPGLQIFGETQESATATGAGGHMRCWTNTSGQVRLVTTGTGTGYLVSLGWRDPRRRLF